jgi:Tfp pilus assembly protein PilN
VIEINLLPGSTKKRGGKPKIARRSAGGGSAKPKLPEFDRTKFLLLAGWVIGLGVVAWMHLGMNSRLEQLSTAHEAAVRDSTRFAMLRAQGDSLMARENEISQKLQVIQEIDAGRYTWPHILDEVSRALPPYIWINTLSEASGTDGLPRVTIDGRAGNYFALGRYIEDLEASPFLRQVRLMSSAQIQVDGRTVLGFAVQASYEEPSPDVIQTVPLFGATQGEN